MHTLLFALTLAAAVGAALMAGTFFAFSVFIMRALARLPERPGIAAMQAINITVIHPLFLGPFLGTGALCLGLAVVGFRRLPAPGGAYLLAGSALYFVVTLLVTMVFNVPLNNRLAKVDPASAEGGRTWRHYLARWTLWNHVRTLGALAALIAFIFAMRR